MLTGNPHKPFKCGNPLCAAEFHTAGRLHLHVSKSRHGCKDYKKVVSGLLSRNENVPTQDSAAASHNTPGPTSAGFHVDGSVDLFDGVETTFGFDTGATPSTLNAWQTSDTLFAESHRYAVGYLPGDYQQSTNSFSPWNTSSLPNPVNDAFETELSNNCMDWTSANAMMVDEAALADMELDGFGASMWNDEGLGWHGLDRQSNAYHSAPFIHEAPPPAPPSAETLYNPYSDSAEPAYRRVKTPNGIVYEHASAGQIIENTGSFPMRTRWEEQRLENIAKYGGNPWGRWGTKDEWETARWMSTAKVPRGNLEELLKTERYANCPPKFKTAKKLSKIVQKDMKGFGGPAWHTHDVILPEAPEEKHLLVYRDVSECGDHLFGCPRFAGKMDFAPRVVFGPDGKREYGNMATADAWNKRQRELPTGTTLGTGILMSDSTKLALHSGDSATHALYMSLGNIDKDVRSHTSNAAWILVAYIPKSRFELTLAKNKQLSKTDRQTLMHLLNRRLFHRCVEIVTLPFRRTKPHMTMDPEGNVRSVIYDLTVYGADLEEQWHLAGLAPNSCPECDSQGKTLGDTDSRTARTSTSILRAIKKVKREANAKYSGAPTPLEFLKLARQHGLNGVDKPFWRKLKKVDICQVLSPDLLHGYHKMFFDHIHHWNMNALTDAEYDARLQSQIPMAGERMFPRGVSKIQQLSGKDHRALERVHVGLVAHGTDKGNARLTKATSAILDCIGIAQFPLQSEASLASFDAAYTRFTENRDIWIKNGCKCGKKGKVVNSWQIPKVHILRHLAGHVRLKGSADNYNTETMEHLHIIWVKDAYRASNRREWKMQIVAWLTRREKIRDFDEWRVWNAEQDQHTAQPVTAATETEAQVTNVTHPPVSQGGEARPQESEVDAYQENLAEGDTRNPNRERRWNVANDTGEQILAGSHYTTREEAGVEVQTRGVVVETGRPTRDQHTISTNQQQHLIARMPNESGVYIDSLAHFPSFLSDIQHHPYISSLPLLLRNGTRLKIWHSMRIHVPPSRYYPHTDVCRIYARPVAGERPAQYDTVMFRADASNNPLHISQTETIHDYFVGRVCLLFSFMPTSDSLHAPVMAYVHLFTKIPSTTSPVSGLYAVRKCRRRQGGPAYVVIRADQIVRPCPLSPVIKGPATRDITNSEALSYYDEFYINKYRHPREFAFIHDL